MPTKFIIAPRSRCKSSLTITKFAAHFFLFFELIIFIKHLLSGFISATFHMMRALSEGFRFLNIVSMKHVHENIHRSSTIKLKHNFFFNLSPTFLLELSHVPGCQLSQSQLYLCIQSLTVYCYYLHFVCILPQHFRHIFLYAGYCSLSGS